MGLLQILIHSSLVTQGTTTVKMCDESTGFHVFQQTHYVTVVSKSSFS
jgi:hypothetical protein